MYSSSPTSTAGAMISATRRLAGPTVGWRRAVRDGVSDEGLSDAGTGSPSIVCRELRPPPDAVRLLVEESVPLPCGGARLGSRARGAVSSIAPQTTRRGSTVRAADVTNDEPAGAPGRPSPREPRQRWRLTFRRGPGAPAVPHREVADSWTARLEEVGLPLPRSAGSRERP